MSECHQSLINRNSNFMSQRNAIQARHDMQQRRIERNWCLDEKKKADHQSSLGTRKVSSFFGARFILPPSIKAQFVIRSWEQRTSFILEEKCLKVFGGWSHRKGKIISHRKKVSNSSALKCLSNKKQANAPGSCHDQHRKLLSSTIINHSFLCR